MKRIQINKAISFLDDCAATNHCYTRTQILCIDAATVQLVLGNYDEAIHLLNRATLDDEAAYLREIKGA